MSIKCWFGFHRWTKWFTLRGGYKRDKNCIITGIWFKTERFCQRCHKRQTRIDYEEFH